MTSRAVEDHVLLVADAFSKMNQKKKKSHKKNRNDKEVFSYRSEARDISILCYRRGDNIGKNKENAQALAYFRLP